MSRFVFIVGFFAIIGFTQCSAAKILCVFPTPIRSHFIFASGLMKGLAEEGHQVTVLSSFPAEKQLQNYRHIQIATGAQADRKDLMEKFPLEGWSHFGTLRLTVNILRQTLQAANFTLHTAEFQRIARGESFDLIFVEMFFNTFLIGLGDHFKCPVITIFSAPATEFINDMSGNPSTVAFVPHFLLGKATEMTFFNRFRNFAFVAVEKFIWAIINWREKIYYEHNFPSPKYKTYEEMKKNVSLIFVNDHFSVSPSKAFVPNVIPVGGLHVKTTPDHLPQEIQDFIDEAEFGVIFFSLGSNMKTSFLPPEMLKTLIATLSKLQQKVLFKWEDDDLADLPKNVMIQKWMPQADILAHENVKLFISHGGLGAMNEARCHGVPIVGIPFFADQLLNLEAAEQEGWAVVLDSRGLTEENLSAAINEVLSDAKYQNAARRASNLFRDRPMTALQTAIYWTEYVIRHRGASHLKSKAADLLWLQKTSLDVVAVYLVLLWFIGRLSISFAIFWRRKHSRRINLASKSKQN
ncbi:UDP-glucosyltransferase 2-like [Phlebotomus argentipes]|uniref:UDP-glucosyltransferase 2-like n=1 Tax=Phlebotomus argentipes TaxID=94469 RepID=UPI0028931816|nr:UDP-glucosyltransferase 2-like [Phlebotomus argentipes]